MKRYRVEIAKAAERQIAKLPKKDRLKILIKIESLAADPRPYVFKKLVYHVEYFRVRVGNYRIIYSILDRELVVSVVEVADRRGAY